MQFDKGYLSPYFITNPENMGAELSNAYLLITDKKLSAAKDIIPILEKVMEKGPQPLLIIAEDIDSEALATLVVNKLKAGLPVCAVKAPGFGDKRKAMLQDIAILTGGQVVSQELGLDLEEVGLEVLGRAKTVKVTKEETTIIDGHGDEKEIKERVKQIRGEIANPKTSDYEREKLEERLASLVGGVAVVNVGAATETELKEKKARVEDALHATRAAVSEGIVPGGGVALLRAVKELDKLKLERRRGDRPQHCAPGGFCAGDRDCQQLRQGRQPDRREDLRSDRRLWLQRLDRRVHRPAESRRHRSGARDQERARQRGFHRLDAAHHSLHGDGQTATQSQRFCNGRYGWHGWNGRYGWNGRHGDDVDVMPTYEYQCASCKHQLEAIQKITADPLKVCPQCGQETLQRGPGGGIGLQFKGSGFYITDYAKKPAPTE